MPIYDFRSDTVTLPTPEMMAAIAAAELGDAARGEDPTVNRLETIAADLTGKDDSLLLPSGTMANLCALIAHGCRGGEVIVGDTAHVYNSEGGGISTLCGAIPRTVDSSSGILDPLEIGAAISGGSGPATAPTRLVCLENSHNDAGGIVAPLDNLATIRDVARGAGLPVHLDGARLFNAGAFLDVPVREICQHADSVWFALSKGLECPIGAVLAGDRDFIAEARLAAKMLGGAMRQAGIIAAPALVALQDPYPVHRRDHELARRLADGIVGIADGLVEAGRVQTNIVNCYVDRFADDAGEIVAALKAGGVLTSHKRTKIRFVTHAQVDEASVDAAVATLAKVLAPYLRGAGEPS